MFPGAAGRHVIFRLRKGKAGSTCVKLVEAAGHVAAEPFLRGEAPVRIFEKSPEQLFRQGRLDLQPPADGWLAKIALLPPLGSLGEVRQGIAENPAAINAKTNRRYQNAWRIGEGVFALTPTEVAALELSAAEQEVLRPYHDLCDLGRYDLAAEPSRMLIYSTKQTFPDAAMPSPAGRALGPFSPYHGPTPRNPAGHDRLVAAALAARGAAVAATKIVALQMAPRPALVPALRPVYVPFSANVFVPQGDTPEHLYYLSGAAELPAAVAMVPHHAKRRGVGLEINGHVLGMHADPATSISPSRPIVGGMTAWWRWRGKCSR